MPSPARFDPTPSGSCEPPELRTARGVTLGAVLGAGLWLVLLLGWRLVSG